MANDQTQPKVEHPVCKDSLHTAGRPRRYRIIDTAHRTILVRDDGHRIDHMIVWPDNHGDSGRWQPWAQYGPTGLDASVADALFSGVTP
jgi:hypothetical protein